MRRGGICGLGLGGWPEERLEITAIIIIRAATIPIMAKIAVFELLVFAAVTAAVRDLTGSGLGLGIPE